MIILERVNNVPIHESELSNELQRWLMTLVDSLNSMIEEIEDAFNVLDAPAYTAAEISAMSSDLVNGVILYDTDNDVYVGKENGSLVQFTTASYP